LTSPNHDGWLTGDHGRNITIGILVVFVTITTNNKAQMFPFIEESASHAMDQIQDATQES